MIPLRVGRVQGVGSLNGEMQQLVHREEPRANFVFHALAFQQFHDNNGLLIVFFHHIKNHADIGVAQRRSRSRLALKTSERVRVASDFIGQKLERDKAMETDVLRFVNHTHSATAQLFDDAIVRDGLAD